MRYQEHMHHALWYWVITTIAVKRQTIVELHSGQIHRQFETLCSSVDSVMKIQYEMYLRCPLVNIAMFAWVAVFNLFLLPSSIVFVCFNHWIHYICICVFESFNYLYLYLCVWIISFIEFVFVVYLLEEQPDTASSGVGVSWVCAGQTHLPLHTNGWSTLSKWNYKHKYKCIQVRISI